MSAERFTAVLLYGAPGVGKGTQGKILGQIPGFFHLSSGEVFRSMDIGSKLGKQVSESISRGELVPDDLTLQIWKQALNGQIATSQYKTHEDLLILDGIPRNVSQTELLNEYIDVRRVIHLVCTDEEAMVHRLKRRAFREHRADDANEEVIRHRFEVYREVTEPVIDCYAKELIADVDAVGSPAEVCRAILECVIPVQNEHFARQNL